MVTGLDSLRKEVDALLRGDHSSYPHTLAGMMQYLMAKEEAEINCVTPPYDDFFERCELLQSLYQPIPEVPENENTQPGRRARTVRKSRGRKKRSIDNESIT